MVKQGRRQSFAPALCECSKRLESVRNQRTNLQVFDSMACIAQCALCQVLAIAESDQRLNEHRPGVVGMVSTSSWALQPRSSPAWWSRCWCSCSVGGAGALRPASSSIVCDRRPRRTSTPAGSDRHTPAGASGFHGWYFPRNLPMASVSWEISAPARPGRKVSAQLFFAEPALPCRAPFSSHGNFPRRLSAEKLSLDLARSTIHNVFL